MCETTVSKELAVENVLIMAERLAFLHYAFAKTLEEELSPEKADKLTRKAIDKYGQLAAESAMKKIESQDLETTLLNFKHGKDLPSMGWQTAPIDKPNDRPCEKISKITYCPPVSYTHLDVYKRQSLYHVRTDYWSHKTTYYANNQ